jgi:hypothetical protein
MPDAFTGCHARAIAREKTVRFFINDLLFIAPERDWQKSGFFRTNNICNVME